MATRWHLTLGSVFTSLFCVTLFIKFSGGMGLSYSGSVDFSTLPEQLSADVADAMSAQSLSKMSSPSRGQLATDSVRYDFRYADSSRWFSVDESVASDEFLELVDRLRPYLKLEAASTNSD